ncbi:hypothetical protein NEHOM01_1462 [Nematocida homosporus]|uniref:uncharacterized protein n=1 Tax=Nematocida homosporus TaxID=1912981 RepID=UPI00221F9235|nr:uncharacterized protein NEHOM01_1462 [Nematocida homosporus]KAI5186429.1 hypothetical protein NEHOM01_1462 [Nematocida homosporus]
MVKLLKICGVVACVSAFAISSALADTTAAAKNVDKVSIDMASLRFENAKPAKIEPSKSTKATSTSGKSTTGEASKTGAAGKSGEASKPDESANPTTSDKSAKSTDGEKKTYADDDVVGSVNLVFSLNRTNSDPIYKSFLGDTQKQQDYITQLKDLIKTESLTNIKAQVRSSKIGASEDDAVNANNSVIVDIDMSKVESIGEQLKRQMPNFKLGSEVTIELPLKLKDLNAIQDQMNPSDDKSAVCFSLSNMPIPRLDKDKDDLVLKPQTSHITATFYTSAVPCRQVIDGIKDSTDSEHFLSKYWHFILIACVLVVGLFGGFIYFMNSKSSS